MFVAKKSLFILFIGTHCHWMALLCDYGIKMKTLFYSHFKNQYLMVAL